MNYAQSINFAELMEPVALRLLGEPKEKHRGGNEWRYRNRGSLSIDLTAGSFRDFENNISGGVVDFVKLQLGCDHAAAVSWMRREGFIPERRPSPPAISTPSSRPQSAPPSPRLKVVETPTDPAIVATYHYTDESGELLFEVVRYEPRVFKQRRPGGRGGWIWKLDGVRRVLYRLPDLLKAVASGETFFITEGEKDCDNVRALGFAATTNPGGAGKWRPEYSELLRGADVVVIADNDAPGRKHVDDIGGALRGIAKRVRVLDIAEHWPQCPDKGDISDWIAAGGTADKLTALIEAAPEWAPTNSQNSQFAASPPWPVMGQEAFYGLAGRVVKTIEPHSEADPNGVLLQFLAAFGNAIGTSPHFLVEGDQHRAKIFVVTSGATSKGRKGTGMGRVRQVMELADPEWATANIQSGLSSGEGVIYAVRDTVEKVGKDGSIETVDQGVADKRCMIVTEEFVGALSVMERAGNTLSPVLRDAWGTARLQTLTKNSPTKATGSHISVIAHVTDDELRAKLTRTEMANGFANRFLFVRVKRSKSLPHGGHLADQALDQLGREVASALEKARTLGRVTMTREAVAEWEAVYPELSSERAGLLGAILGRAEAQVIRLAVIYAALDNSTEIDVAHLEAALTIWDFCEESARQIFGDVVGDDIADAILGALRADSPNGITRTDISAVFQRHVASARISLALDLLRRLGLAESKIALSGRHKVETWFAVTS